MAALSCLLFFLLCRRRNLGWETTWELLVLLTRAQILMLLLGKWTFQIFPCCCLKAYLRCSKSSSNTCSAKKASLIMRSALLQSTSWHRAIAKGGSWRLKDTQRIWIGAIDQQGKKFIGKSRQGLEIKWNNSGSWNETFLRIWEIKSFLSRWKFELIQEYISFELGLIWVF